MIEKFKKGIAVSESVTNKGHKIGYGPSRLSDFAGSRDNNFNLIRLVAASLVIVTHSFTLVLGKGHGDPISGFSGGLELATIAVDIFFLISGFLVTGSLFARKSFIAFCWARVLRIYPALIVVVLFCISVVGVLFTTESVQNYCSDPHLLLFFAKSGSLLWNPEYYLPGVFMNNPYPGVVNGSLWTLPWELRMYGLLVLLWLAFKMNFSRAITVLVPLALGLTLTLRIFNVGGPKYLHDGVRFISFFFMGAFFFIHKNKVALNKSVAVLLTVILLSSMFINKSTFYFLYIFILPYLVFAAAYLPGGIIRKFNILGDYSYGVYIFAFPIQQAIIVMNPEVEVWQLIISSWLITLCFAICSWHLIEHPCLKQKNNYKMFERLVASFGLTNSLS